MTQSMIAAAAIAAVALAAATPAFAAGQVYGDYGQGRYAAPPPAESGDCDADVVIGTGLGAVIGGVIGNQFGKGSGRTAATIGGVILGGIAGNRIAKDVCTDDRHDAHYYNDTYADAFDEGEEGREYEWRNPHTDNYGYVTPGETYNDGYGAHDGPCREFSQRVFIDDRPETAYGVACRQADGSWRIVGGE